MSWRNHPAAKGESYRRAIAGERALLDKGFRHHEVDATIKLALNMPDSAFEDGTAPGRVEKLWQSQGKSPEHIAAAFDYHRSVSETGHDPYDTAPPDRTTTVARTAELRQLSADPSSEYWTGGRAQLLQAEHTDLIQLSLDRQPDRGDSVGG